MPEVDSKLVASLRQAKTTPMFFAFVAKGATDGVLIVSKKQIPAKEINEAKTSSGGKLVFKGRCTGEDGKLVFELPKEPPGTLAKQLKTVIQRDAGMNLQVETRVSAELEGEEGEGEQTATKEPGTAPPPAPPPPPPPGDPAARFATRLKALAPVMQKAEATGSAQALEAKKHVADGNKLYVAKQYDGANAELDKAEALIKQALTSGAKPPPTPEAKPVSNVVFTQSRLLWDTTRKNIQIELQGMEKKIIEHCQSVNNDPDSDGEYDLNEAGANVKALYTILSKLDERLMDKLDEALNAADPELRKAKQQEAKGIIDEYKTFVNSDPLIAAMTTSTIAPSKIQQSILNVLNGLSSKL